MNQEEIAIFVNQWVKGYCMKQKMGYLFGYYASDPNFAGGVRAVVELIYEPPQIGDANSVEPLNDIDRPVVDRICQSLTFELLGM
jgi:nuclear protein localization family protein 4